MERQQGTCLACSQSGFDTGHQILIHLSTTRSDSSMQSQDLCWVWPHNKMFLALFKQNYLFMIYCSASCQLPISLPIATLLFHKFRLYSLLQQILNPDAFIQTVLIISIRSFLFNRVSIPHNHQYSPLGEIIP